MVKPKEKSIMPDKAYLNPADYPTTKTTNLRHNKKGEEVLNPTPMQPPLGYKKTPTLHEQIRMQVMQMKLDILSNADVAETDDEADDFEVADDAFPMSKHENDHMPSIKELKAKAREINTAIQEANRRAAIAAHEKALKKPTSVTTPPAQPPADANTD